MIEPINRPYLQEALEDMIADTSSSPSDDENNMILCALEAVQRNRYLRKRKPLPKIPALADVVLLVYETQRPREFRKFARMNPETFDLLVSQLEQEEVFSSSSSSGEQQMATDLQILIALYRFGHFGNGGSVGKVAMICGVGAGTVDLVTRRVITAVRTAELRKRHIRWPKGAEREEAKQVVEDKSGIPEWRNGWCMADGTLIPLYQKPTY